MISVSWYQTQPPTLEQWTNRLRRVHNGRNDTAQLQMKKDIFRHLERWTPVTLYLVELKNTGKKLSNYLLT